MSLSEQEPDQRTRRRGAALEAALLDAAWEELVDKGYDRLTFEAVAERAHTSRAVLYRRWPTKPDLARAALEHGWASTPVELPDTGSVREDLIELLRQAGVSRMRLVTAVTARLGAFFAETGSSIADLRDSFARGRTSGVDTVLARGVERGEIDPAKLTPRVAGVPFDLFRAEIFMTLRPVPDEVLESIVDEVFLPLVRPAGWPS